MDDLVPRPQDRACVLHHWIMTFLDLGADRIRTEVSLECPPG